MSPSYIFLDEESGRDQLANRLKVIQLIRGNAKAPVRHKDAMHRGKEDFRHQAATMMPPLRPWIGKQKVDDIDGVRRKQIFDGIGSFHAQDAHIA